MKRKILTLAVALLLTGSSVQASSVHKVVSGDTMWKISKKYGVAMDDIISANPQIKNPAVIYPGQSINIPSDSTQSSSYQTEVIRLTNQERAKYGLSPLKHNTSLSRVAQAKSQDMKDKNYFSHTSPTYGSPFEMMKSFGISYRYAAENIAKGQKTPAAVVNAWMNSSGHRANILNASYTEIGIGYVSDGNIWTQMFIGK